MLDEKLLQYYNKYNCLIQYLFLLYGCLIQFLIFVFRRYLKIGDKQFGVIADHLTIVFDDATTATT